jgi:hypothetical protein
MKHFLLIYDYAPDYLERRGPLRTAHLQKAWAASEGGQLLLGGVLTDPVDTGLLLFQGDGPEAAEAFARADPYVTEGLVRSWRVREWLTVAGEGAAQPVKP